MGKAFTIGAVVLCLLSSCFYGPGYRRGYYDRGYYDRGYYNRGHHHRHGYGPGYGPPPYPRRW